MYFGKTFKDYLKLTGEVGYVKRVVHSVLFVDGLPQAEAREVVIFEDDNLGEIISLGEDYCEVLPYFKDKIKIGMRLTRTGRRLEIGVGGGLLGKTIDPLGNVIDGGGAIGFEAVYLTDSDPVGILQRGVISEALETGVSLVDLTLPLGRGQRELVVGDRKTGKSEFLMQVLETQAKKGTVCIYAGIGKRRSDIKSLMKSFSALGISGNTILVVSTPEDASGLIFMTPFSALALAEFFRDRGRDVLVILDDMTNHARYWREISLLAQRFPGRSSYPGDIFYVHARLLERAGKFARGSITCLPVAELIFGDLTGYIQSNLAAMTDGHLYFDADLYHEGRRPAINPFLSVTRVGLQAQTPFLRSLSRQLSGFLVEINRLKEFLHFGAELSESIKRNLDMGDRLFAFLWNQPHAVRPVNASVIVVSYIFSGVWREVPMSDFLIKTNAMVQKYVRDAFYREKVDKAIASSREFSDLLTKIKDDPGAFNV